VSSDFDTWATEAAADQPQWMRRYFKANARAAWIAAEDSLVRRCALVLRILLFARGPMTARQIALRVGCEDNDILEMLLLLSRTRDVVMHGTAWAIADRWRAPVERHHRTTTTTGA
jgi:hypothetical protein